MAEIIKVNIGRMESDVNNIRDYVERISNQYMDLVQKKAQLDAMWDGPASESLKTSFDDDLNALMTMISNLQKLCNYENMAKEFYQSCENQVSAVISDI